MQLPKGVEWAAHSLVVLARIGSSRPVPSAVLADVYGLSAPYLNKHLRKLAANGLLTSTSGPSGGFALARPAEEITMADVVEALEGRGPLFRCTEIRCDGLFRDRAAQIKAGRPCGIAAAMSQAEAAWRSSLAAVTIADLAAGLDDRYARRLSEFVHPDTRRGERQT